MRSRNRKPSTITVVHSEYGRYTAVGVWDKLGAVQAAAKAWKAQWSKIARACEFIEEDITGTPESAQALLGERRITGTSELAPEAEAKDLEVETTS